MEKNKEKEICLSDFKVAMEEGTKRFKILNAEYDTINTKKGESEVIRMRIELEDIDNPLNNMILENHLMFIDYTPRGRFNQFVQSVLTATGKQAFVPNDIIGLEGKVDLSFYRPEGSDFSYERLDNFIFSAPRDEVKEKLNTYIDQDDDFDF